MPDRITALRCPPEAAWYDRQLECALAPAICELIPASRQSRQIESCRSLAEKFRQGTSVADLSRRPLLSNRARPLCCDTADAGCPHPPPATAQSVERSPFDLADRFARAFEPSGDFLECVLATVRDAVPQFEHATFP